MRASHLLAICALLFVAASNASAQEAESSFVAEPTPGSQTAATGGYFVLDATPGETVRQSVGLRNDSEEDLELRLAAVDATTGQLGGVSYALAEEAPSRAGAWITLERRTVTLDPGSSAIVSFRVAVPTGASSGHHLAGLSIAAPSAGGDAGEAAQGEAGASIDVETRRIIAVQINLPGPAEPELVIEGVAPAARPDGLYLEIAIENQGRGLTKGQGVVRVGDDFEREFDVDTFVPGTAIAYPVKWTTQLQSGRHHASVELHYGEEVARWEGSFVVDDDTLDELAERQVAVPTEDADDDSWSPVAIIGAGLAAAAVVGAGGYALARVQRR